MEALFGYVATNKKSSKGNNNTTNPRESNSGPSAKTFILDTRKSQNIAVVLKSLSISRQEILDALMDAQGLDADTLEKLTKMTPTEEEKSQILVYDGNPTRLADAECFLYHILKAVPSAFARIDAMLFKFNYDSEISHLKESIQTLALACKELRTRGLFTKLLEAILKAGNHMNAGTSRGNAQAFDLTSLRKLSDVKSTDGKTTLLNFVLEEVVRSEGKRCVLNRSSALSRNSSQSNSTSNLNSESMTSKEEKEKEYITLGLPVVGGLSSEFSNVKKAATIDYDNYTRTCSALTKHVTDIKQLVTHCVNDGGQRFAREMKRFLEVAETELEVLREEQDKVMELVKRTTEYYQAKASKDKRAYPFQLFVIVRDFLIMVDQECVEVARKVQKKRGTARLGSSSPNSTPNRVTLRFPKLPEHFM